MCIFEIVVSLSDFFVFLFERTISLAYLTGLLMDSPALAQYVLQRCEQSYGYHPQRQGDDTYDYAAAPVSLTELAHYHRIAF